MVLLSGVWTARRGEPRDDGSALMARREGVTTVILVGASAGVRGVDMVGDEVQPGQLELSSWYSGCSSSSAYWSKCTLRSYLGLRVSQAEFIQSASTIEGVVMTRCGGSRRVKWEVRISRRQPIDVRQNNSGAWVRVRTPRIKVIPRNITEALHVPVHGHDEDYCCHLQDGVIFDTTSMPRHTH